MKKSVLFFAAAILLGIGLQSCDREDNNGDNNGGGSGGSNSSVVWVDLGLPSGLLWADRNVGASSPEDYGNYYAWGETAPKEVYDWSTYAYCDYDALTKYCSDASFGLNGFTDNLTTLQASDDAATANLGGGARTPTKDEWQELRDNTIGTWTFQGGVKGLLLTAANGKSLFLPAAGYRRYDTSLSNAGEYGTYWSSTLNTASPYYAWSFYFYLSNHYMTNNGRGYGFSVRAVRASQH